VFNGFVGFCEHKWITGFRRIESPRIDVTTLTEINRIHSLNQDRIRLYMNEYMMVKKNLIMSDQCGLLVHPSDDRVWCKKGKVDEGDGSCQLDGNYRIIFMVSFEGKLEVEDAAFGKYSGLALKYCLNFIKLTIHRVFIHAFLMIKKDVEKKYKCINK
jgi:hypothetical protein